MENTEKNLKKLCEKGAKILRLDEDGKLIYYRDPGSCFFSDMYVVACNEKCYFNFGNGLCRSDPKPHNILAAITKKSVYWPQGNQLEKCITSDDSTKFFATFVMFEQPDSTLLDSIDTAELIYMTSIMQNPLCIHVEDEPQCNALFFLYLKLLNLHRKDLSEKINRIIFRNEKEVHGDDENQENP